MKRSRAMEGRQWFRDASAALLLAWSAAALARDTTPPAAADVTDADLAGITCSISEEKFLPADYYYCLASQSYGYKRYPQALRYFRTAASWASKPAQYVLGVMALNGDQQPIDRGLAFAWFTLAAERRQSAFEDVRQQLSTTLTPQERTDAETDLQTMRPVYGDDVAAIRAERRYHDSMLMLAHRNTIGDYCISGMRLGGGASADGSNSSIECAPIPAIAHVVDQAAERVFDGWSGHVSVGPLQPVNAASPKN